MVLGGSKTLAWVFAMEPHRMRVLVLFVIVTVILEQSISFKAASLATTKEFLAIRRAISLNEKFVLFC